VSRRAEMTTNTWWPLRSCPYVALSLGQEWARVESRPTAVTRWDGAGLDRDSIKSLPTLLGVGILTSCPAGSFVGGGEVSRSAA